MAETDIQNPRKRSLENNENKEYDVIYSHVIDIYDSILYVGDNDIRGTEYGLNYLIRILNNDYKRYKMIKCPGCYPINQLNQEGHVGYCGCLETDMLLYTMK